MVCLWEFGEGGERSTLEQATNHGETEQRLCGRNVYKVQHNSIWSKDKNVIRHINSATYQV